MKPFGKGLFFMVKVQCKAKTCSPLSADNLTKVQNKVLSDGQIWSRTLLLNNTLDS